MVNTVETLAVRLYFVEHFKTKKKPVIVKNSSPKNLLADCRSTVGRQLTNRLPTGYEKRKIVVNTSS